MNTQNYAVNIRVGLANPARVNISQGDTGRTLAFSLYDGLSPFTPPTGSTVTIVGRKPSKLGFSEACTVSGNVATVTTTLAMTQEAGKFPVELRIEANGESIGTANFTMYIEPSPHPDGTTDGTHATVDNLQTQIGNLANLATTAKTNLVSAINEAAQSGGVVIDDTLTQTGAAADSKKTGDEIALLKADLGDIEDLFTTTETVDFSTAFSGRGMVNSSNKWSLTSGYYSYRFAIESGQYDAVTVTANATLNAVISFLASRTLSPNDEPTWASGYIGRQTVPAGETRTFAIPEDCVYIVVTKNASSNIYEPTSMAFKVRKAPILESAPPLGLHETPPTLSALNIVKRCRQMTDIKWTPAVDLPRYILAQTSNPPDTAEGQRYKGTFKAGVEYKGIPYGRTQDMSSYGYDYATVGRYIDFGTFISSVSNPKSQLSVRDVGSVAGHTSVIYASVCSGLACYALGVNEVATANIPSISGLSLVGKVNNNGTLLSDTLFKIGDVLNLQGSHVGIITDIIRDGNGLIQLIEISECTASGLADKNYLDGLIGGVARRKGWTRWNLFYERWKDYSLYRYSGTVTYTPSQYVNVGDEFDGYVVEHFPIMPYEGEGFAYKTGYIPNNAVKLVYTLSDYAYVKVFKDGAEISGSPFALTEGADSINIDTITAGDYSAYLCNIDNGDVANLTYPCHWSIE